MMFPLPPNEAAVIGELQRLLGAHEVETLELTPPVAFTRDDRVVPVDDGFQVSLWNAA